jgi:hypothetical protein
VDRGRLVAATLHQSSNEYIGRAIHGPLTRPTPASALRCLAPMVLMCDVSSSKRRPGDLQFADKAHASRKEPPMEVGQRADSRLFGALLTFVWA